jgi:hypothetical protein
MHACDKFKPFFPPKPPAAEAKVGWRAIFGEQSLDVNDTCLLNIVCEDSGFLEVQFLRHLLLQYVFPHLLALLF